MIMEALKYIVGLAKPTQIEHAGLTYSDRPVQLLKPPVPEKLSVRTLQGLMDAIASGFEDLTATSVEKEILLHVITPTQVEVFDRASDDYGRRQVYVNADCAENLPRYGFGQFVSAEQFIISLQAKFVAGVGDIDYLLQTSSSLTTENVATSADDGITQRTALRRGVVLKEGADIKARVKLAPYCTFPEIEQPVSEFLFRLRPVEGGTPLCALFEADGGKWRLDAMSRVAAWLSRNNEKVTVIS